MIKEMYEGETLRERVDRETENARTILKDIDLHRVQAHKAGLSFTGLTEAQLLRKLRSVNSPMIVWQSWGSGTPGSTITYSVGISNPDPTEHIWLFGHLFVGAANIAPDVSESLSVVDARFPRLTLPAFPGMTVKAGTIERLDFTLKIPAGVEITNYMGNFVLYKATWHEPATYLDRGLFVFAVN